MKTCGSNELFWIWYSAQACSYLTGCLTELSREGDSEGVGNRTSCIEVGTINWKEEVTSLFSDSNASCMRLRMYMHVLKHFLASLLFNLYTPGLPVVVTSFSGSGDVSTSSVERVIKLCYTPSPTSSDCHWQTLLHPSPTSSDCHWQTLLHPFPY